MNNGKRKECATSALIGIVALGLAYLGGVSVGAAGGLVIA